jgi:hypothetical protein
MPLMRLVVPDLFEAEKSGAQPGELAEVAANRIFFLGDFVFGRVSVVRLMHSEGHLPGRVVLGGCEFQPDWPIERVAPSQTA